MRLHCLLWLDDNKSAASCQLAYAWCKLIIETFYPQAWCKLFQQLAESLQISSCNKSDFHKLAASWWSQQTCWNLLTTCIKLVKFTSSTTCSKSVAFLAVYAMHTLFSKSVDNNHCCDRQVIESTSHDSIGCGSIWKGGGGHRLKRAPATIGCIYISCFWTPLPVWPDFYTDNFVNESWHFLFFILICHNSNWQQKIIHKL